MMDKFSKKARMHGFRARSVYKIKEINSKYNVVRSGNDVLDIGAYPGSWMQACIDFNCNYILGVDIRQIENISGTDFIKVDISKDEVFEKISEKKKMFDVVISDVAPKTSGTNDAYLSYLLCLRSFEIAKRFLKQNGNFLCKIYMGEDFEGFLRLLKENFSFVRSSKPNSSKKKSREIYIVAKSYKAKRRI